LKQNCFQFFLRNSSIGPSIIFKCKQQISLQQDLYEMRSCRLGTAIVSNNRPSIALKTTKAVQKSYPHKAAADSSLPAHGGPLWPAPSYPVTSGFRCGLVNVIAFVACWSA